MAVVGTIELLPVGSPVPDVSLINQDGNPVSLTDYKGQKLIVFIYAKGGSGSCLKETLSMKEGYESLKAKGYEVVGLSPDKEKAQKREVDKRELPFDLISDPENKLIEALGAWGLKKMYGKEYMGVIRSTFLIDEAGNVEQVIEKVKTKDHAEQILELIS
ncbi:MAG: peroxiredoxin [Bacteroidota bacterium]